MSEIRTPVTVQRLTDDEFLICDGDGQEIDLADLVRALNAMPKWAFAELTDEAAGVFVDRAVLAARHAQETDKSRAVGDSLRRDLQSFAAPVASVAVPDGYVLVHKEIIQFDITGYPAMEAKAHELSARSCDRAKRGVGVDPVILLEEAEELLTAGLSEMRPAPVAPAWLPIETAPKGKAVLVFYRNSLGKGRTVKATFIERFTQESYGEGYGIEEYDEANDRYTWPEGWYEQIDNWEYAAAMFASDHKPTHWRPLPAAPETQGGAEDA